MAQFPSAKTFGTFEKRALVCAQSADPRYPEKKILKFLPPRAAARPCPTCVYSFANCYSGKIQFQFSGPRKINGSLACPVSL